MALTKTGSTVLFAIASVASNTDSVGAALDCSTWYGCDVRIRMGRGTGSAFTTSPIARIEGSYATGTPTADQWALLAQFQPANGGAPNALGSQAVSGTVAAGATTALLAAGTNFIAGDFVFFHASTLANSEWSKVVSVSSATLTLQEALARAATGATARNQAEEFHALLDLTGIHKLRVVVRGYGSGQANIWAAEADGVTAL